MSDYCNADCAARLALATADRTSAEVLQRLATDPEAEVRRAVASNPNTPKDALLQLGEEFPDAIVANPIFNILLIENPEDRFVRLSLARSSTTSVQTLANLAQLANEEVLCAIAENPITPVSMLEQLVQNPHDFNNSVWIRFDRVFASVAKNPNIPASLLTQLAEHGGSRPGLVHLAIAENSSAPVELLRELLNRFSGGNTRLWQAMLRNPRTPAEILEKLAVETIEEIGDLIKQHPNVSQTAIDIVHFFREESDPPIKLLIELAKHHRVHVLQRVADHPGTPDFVLRLLAQRVADHPATPNPVLRQLARSEDAEVLRSIVNHPHVSSATLEAVLKTAIEANQGQALLEEDKSYHAVMSIYWNLAKHPLITPEALAKITDFGAARRYTSELLIEHPKTPSQSLEKLAAETDLLPAIAAHPNLSLERLKRLINSTDLHIRLCAASNPSLPITILRELVGDASDYVHSAQAADPTQSAALLSVLVSSQSRAVRERLAKSIRTPDLLLETLAHDRDFRIRSCVAQNHSAPGSTLKHLAADSALIVWKSVAKNEQTSLDVRIELANKADTKDFHIWVRLAKSPDLSKTAIERFTEITIDRVLTLNQKKSAARSTELRLCAELLANLTLRLQTPPHILEMFALNQPTELYQRIGEKRFWLIRYTVVSNPNTPISTLEKLAQDCDPSIMAWAQQKLEERR